jgi:hypothetical protein
LRTTCASPYPETGWSEVVHDGQAITLEKGGMGSPIKLRESWQSDRKRRKEPSIYAYRTQNAFGNKDSLFDLLKN